MPLALRILAALLLVVAVVAVATWWRASARKAAAEERYPPEGRFVEVGGHPVHYVQRGAGPDVVLIHGASGNTRDMTFAFADRLADRYRVTVFDRPGHGYTPRLAQAGVTVADQARLLSEAALALGVTRPVVVGQSFGGAVAMAWAVHHPERAAAVVSVAGATHPWEGTLDRLYATLALPWIGRPLAWLIAAWVPMDFVERQVAGVFAPQAEPPGYAGHIGLGLVMRPRNILANAHQRTDLRAELRAQRKAYPDLAMPIEIVHGTADTIVGLQVHAEKLADEAPKARLTRLPGIGHMPHHADPGATAAAIDRAAERAGLR